MERESKKRWSVVLPPEYRPGIGIYVVVPREVRRGGAYRAIGEQLEELARRVDEARRFRGPRGEAPAVAQWSAQLQAVEQANFERVPEDDRAVFFIEKVELERGEGRDAIVHVQVTLPDRFQGPSLPELRRGLASLAVLVRDQVELEVRQQRLTIEQKPEVQVVGVAVRGGRSRPVEQVARAAERSEAYEARVDGQVPFAERATEKDPCLGLKEGRRTRDGRGRGGRRSDVAAEGAALAAEIVEQVREGEKTDPDKTRQGREPRRIPREGPAGRGLLASEEFPRPFEPPEAGRSLDERARAFNAKSPFETLWEGEEVQRRAAELREAEAARQASRAEPPACQPEARRGRRHAQVFGPEDLARVQAEVERAASEGQGKWVDQAYREIGASAPKVASPQGVEGLLRQAARETVDVRADLEALEGARRGGRAVMVEREAVELALARQQERVEGQKERERQERRERRKTLDHEAASKRDTLDHPERLKGKLAVAHMMRDARAPKQPSNEEYARRAMEAFRARLAAERGQGREPGKEKAERAVAWPEER